MKLYARIVAFVALGALGGCADSDDGFPNPLSRTGRDARVYNPMTGRYEWPAEPVTRTGTPRSTRRPSAPASAAPTSGMQDDRSYNPQTGRFDPAPPHER